MMEDIEDTIDQLVSTGVADPNRVAIMGGSFGGYAALMCAARRPELYKAVVSLNGVSDLPAMLRYERSGGRDPIIYEFWAQRIGDLQADADQIRRASPALQAERFNAPVLLLHGRADSTVPIEQSRLMSQALQRARKDVEMIVMEDTAHGGFNPELAQAMFVVIPDFIKKAFDKVA